MTDFLIAYGMHSTVLLASAWCLMKIARPRSPVVRERLWKLAAVLPVLTAVSSVGFRSAKAVPFAERKATIVEAVASATVAEPESDDLVGGVAAQAEPVNLPVADEVIDVEQQAVELVAPQNVVESDSKIEIVDRFFEPVVRIENPGDELPSDSRVELDEPKPQSLVDDVPLAGPSVMTAHEVAWQPILTFVSPALSAWVAISVLWLLVRSMWFRSRLRKARRIDRGRAVELLRELNVAVTLRVTSRTSSDPETETTSDFGRRRFVGKVLRSAQLVTRSVTATLVTSSPRVRLLIVPGFSEPAAFGIWRPTIVLPPSCESLLREELRAVLAHELGHIVRGDVWWLLIGRLLTTVLGFQPLNRIARREWTAAAECLCDSWAVDRGVERLTLARCLTALAEHRLTGVSLADALAAVGSPSSLRTRIERLVADPVVDPWSKRSRRWLVNGSVIAAAVSLAMLMPSPRFSPTPVIAHEVADDSDLLNEIDEELNSLHDDLSRAEDLAEASGHPESIMAARLMREREGRFRDRWSELSAGTGRNAVLHTDTKTTRMKTGPAQDTTR